VSNGSNKKVANSLVALSSAAVLSVYGAGYVRTRAAADRIDLQAAERRSHTRPSRREVERTGQASASPNTAPAAPPIVADSNLPAPAVAASPSEHAATIAAAPEHTAAARPGAATATAHDAPTAQRRIDDSSPTPQTQTADATPPPVEAAPAPAVASTPPASEGARYRDGTFFGWGTSRHGDIQAAVLIEEGRIVSATVAQCLTRYSCSWITPLPPRIVRDQGTTFDYVSGATESSDAFQDAVADALTHAQ